MPSEKTIWLTMPFEMRARVVLSALVFPLTLLALYFEASDPFFTPFVLLLAYWVLRSIVMRSLHFFGLVNSNGSLFEHLMDEALIRSRLFANIFLLFGILFIGYACFFSPDAPPWLGQ